MMSGARADRIRGRKCRDCFDPIPMGESWCPTCGGLPIEPEPSRCPKCGAVHNLMIPGRQCGLCGHTFESRLRSRPVVTVDGELVEMPGDTFLPRRTKVYPTTVGNWTKMYYRFKKSGRTFNQAEAKFLLEHHYYPPRDLLLMPKREEDWYLAIKDVPDSDLTAGYGTAKDEAKKQSSNWIGW